MMNPPHRVQFVADTMATSFGEGAGRLQECLCGGHFVPHYRAFEGGGSFRHSRRSHCRSSSSALNVMAYVTHLLAPP